MNDRKPTIYVVDDDEAVRNSLQWLIASIDLEVRTYGSAQEFLADFSPEAPGCLVVDVRMPGMSGLELQRQLVDRGSDIPVVVITGHGDVEMAVRAMKAGAFDFIQKPFNDQVLLDLIQTALEKSTRVARAQAERTHVRDQLDQLTEREREVLNGIVAGESNRQIATRLDLSEKTIEFHRAKVMRKMEAGSLAELTRKVVLAEPEPQT
ncbi:MAG TPA: response regulator FixJ [Alphaproteobacteria bacterium]